VKTQVWIAICVYVLVAIIRKELKVKHSLHEILQILSVSLFEKTPIIEALSLEKPGWLMSGNWWCVANASQSCGVASAPQSCSVLMRPYSTDDPGRPAPRPISIGASPQSPVWYPPLAGEPARSAGPQRQKCTTDVSISSSSRITAGMPAAIRPAPERRRPTGPG
jgi:hypothetical protein